MHRSTIYITFFFGLTLFLSISCKETSTSVVLVEPQTSSYGVENVDLTKEEYYDKVLGALVGSAIGDAMGSSTEMWNRDAIQLRYGYILGLTDNLREQSPEGPWQHNLPAGTTTDDTRWKYLMTQYIVNHGREMNAANFANFITSYYTNSVKNLATNDILRQTDALDTKIKKIYWIKEWARVAFAFQKDPKAYHEAKDRFYGGEMSCAGLLYTPMLGLLAQNATTAYTLAHDHTMFDIGYARDISSIAAALCNVALQTDSIDEILKTVPFVDPVGYQDSRLVGRIPLNIANAAENTVLTAWEIDEIPLLESLIQNDSLLLLNSPKGLKVKVHRDSLQLKIPSGFPESTLAWFQQEKVYQALEKDQKTIAFHSGEIWQILYTALKFGRGNFTKTMQFIINYGRDNDTVAAVAGMILGAKDGYSALPEELKVTVLQINQENLGIDLEAMATAITNVKYP